MKTDTKDLKIISMSQLQDINTGYGLLLRKIEYLKNNPETKRINLDDLTKLAVEIRDLIREI